MFRALLTVLAMLVVFPFPAWAGKSVSVRGYHRKDGTYVSPHTRSSPGSGSYSSHPVFVPPPVVPRTATRTTPRTSAAKSARTEYPTLTPSAIDREPAETKQTPSAKVARPSGWENLSDEEILEKKAAAKLVLAKQFIEQDRIPSAVKWLKEIVKDFPTTKAAEAAKQLLKKHDHGA